MCILIVGRGFAAFSSQQLSETSFEICSQSDFPNNFTKLDFLTGTKLFIACLLVSISDSDDQSDHMTAKLD